MRRHHDGRLDAEEWSAQLTELVCERSAVIRLRASVVDADRRAALPSVLIPNIETVPQYLDLDAGEQAGQMSADHVVMRPRDFELAVELVVPNALVDDLVAEPELTRPP